MARKEPPPRLDETLTKRIGDAAPDAGQRWLCLVVSSARGVTIVPVPRGPSVVLGRSPEADVVVEDTSVSRRHARLHVQDSSMELEDLGSSNGTVVDGVVVPRGARIPVRVGSSFELGATTIVLQRAVSFIGQSRAGSAVRTIDADETVVCDPAMQRLYQLQRVIARSPLPVLIQGETGTGKELFAHGLHRESARASQPFVAINCAALAESLIESELFGYERGAFTGAAQAKAGLLETADGGTLFLDEVGEMSPGTQAKLLRVLETGEVMRIGSTKARHVDVRTVCATNRDLRELVAHGRFRADLFYRLSGATLSIPPLRKRVSEIAPLARLFASRMARLSGKPEPTLTRAAIAALERYPWPGNVRELRNVVERATVVASGRTIDVGDLELPEPMRAEETAAAATIPPPVAPTAPPPASAPGATTSLRERMEAVERASIEDALARAEGNQSRAARILGISRGMLLKRIAAYGLGRKGERER